MSHKNKLFFHEDLYKQIELIPRKNYFATQKAIAELPHGQGSADGFLTCVIRPEHPAKLSDENIIIDMVNKMLKPLALSFYDQIVSGYSTKSYDVPNTVAWGFERYGIFVEYKSGIVTGLWLCQSSMFVANNFGVALKSAILLLSSKLDLVLVDWNQEILIDTSQEKLLGKYSREVLGFRV